MLANNAKIAPSVFAKPVTEYFITLPLCFYNIFFWNAFGLVSIELTALLRQHLWRKRKITGIGDHLLSFIAERV